MCLFFIHCIPQVINMCLVGNKVALKLSTARMKHALVESHACIKNLFTWGNSLARIGHHWPAAVPCGQKKSHPAGGFFAMKD
jgi:hypothetical protein